MEDKRIPVTVLTGFLGSGKTTLLNRILRENHGLRIAVIENEFGEIGIDHELVIGAEEEIFEMNNGCICCTVRGDLIRILGELVKRRKKFDYVLIETTGLADPGPVAQTFFVDDKMARHFRLDGIVTLVDAAHVEQHLDDSSECVEQIAFADIVILNKTDLVETGAIARLQERVHAINAAAKVYRAKGADVPIENLLNQRAFELETKLEMAPNFLREEMPFEWAGEYSLESGQYEFHFSPGPDASMQMMAMPLPAGQTLHDAIERTKAAFETEAQNVQAGGTLTSGSLVELQFHAEGGRFLLDVSRAGRYALWTQHGPDEFAMRFVHDEEELEPLFSEEFAGAHSHDETVSSVGIDVPGNCDPDLLNDWLSELLQTRGEDIFRMKGVLAIEGEAERFVFQGVHMLFEGQPDRLWEPGEARRNQLIFIGRNLDRAELNAGFRACLSSALIFKAAAAVR